MVASPTAKVFLSAMKIKLEPLVLAKSEELVMLLNDPRVTRHMPLAEVVDLEWVDNWKTQKSSSWDSPDKGPWSVSINGKFAGWAGLQPDDGDTTELAVVLHQWAWGHGKTIIDKVLETWGAFPESKKKIFVYFPSSRKAESFAGRIGISYSGTGEFNGIKFERFELLQS